METWFTLFIILACLVPSIRNTPPVNGHQGDTHFRFCPISPIIAVGHARTNSVGTSSRGGHHFALGEIVGCQGEFATASGIDLAVANIYFS